MKIISDIQDVISTPLSEKIDLKHLFLLTGLVMIFTAMWAFILANVKSAAMEVIE